MDANNTITITEKINTGTVAFLMTVIGLIAYVSSNSGSIDFSHHSRIMCRNCCALFFLNYYVT